MRIRLEFFAPSPAVARSAKDKAKSTTRSRHVMLMPALGLLAACLAVAPAQATSTTWAIGPDASFSGYILSGMFTIDNTTGAVDSFNLDLLETSVYLNSTLGTVTSYNDIFDATTAFVANAGLSGFTVQLDVANRIYANTPYTIDLSVPNGDSFADAVATLPLNGATGANGCCAYVTPGAVFVNESIPEPTSLALFAIGTAALFRLRRRYAD